MIYTPDVKALFSSIYGSNDYEYKLGRYSPSDAGTCMREWFLKYVVPDEAKQEDEESWGVFERGKDVERKKVKALKEKFGKGRVLNDVRIEIDLREDFGFRVTGYTDPIIVWNNLIPILVYEVKSTGNVGDNPSLSQHHLFQLTVYLKALEDLFPEKPMGIVGYLDRNNYHCADFESILGEEIWELVLSRYIRHHKNLKDGVIPAKDPLQSWQCDEKYCNFYELCESFPEDKCYFSDYKGVDENGVADLRIPEEDDREQELQDFKENIRDLTNGGVELEEID